MTEHKGACCSSPASMCYWCVMSLIAWGVLSLIGWYWRPLHASSAITILFAMAIGCVANWVRNRTFHCGMTAPLFLIAAVVFLLSDVRVLHVNGLLGLVICSRRSVSHFCWNGAMRSVPHRSCDDAKALVVCHLLLERNERP